MNVFDPMPIDLFRPVNPDHPLNRNRIAWYLAIEGLSGGKTFQDLMLKSPGTLTNMGTDGGWRGTTRPGGYGHLLFDATDDYVACGKPNGTAGLSTGYTLAGWVYYKSLNGGRWIGNVDVTGGVYQYDQYVPADGSYQHYISDGSSYVVFAAAAGTIVTGRWVHIVVTNNGTCDASGNLLYLNGVPTAWTRTPAGTPTVPTSGFGNTALGRAGDFNGGYLDGMLDDVGLWTRPLSASESRALYDLSRIGYPGMLNRFARPITLVRTTGDVPPDPIPDNPYTLSGTGIEQITDIVSSAQMLSARTHRQSAYTENPIELWYLRDDAWRLFPVQPLSGPDRGVELTQTYKQPATLGFTLPDPQGLYAAENRNSAYNYNAANAFDPLLDEARKIVLRVGTKCYTNLATGHTPTASAAVTLGSLVKLIDGKFTDWTGGTPFDFGAAFAFSGTAPTIDVTVDLGASYALKHAVIRFGTRIGGFTLPASVTVQLSADNVTYRSWPVRPVGGPSGDWAEDYDGQAVEVAVCDLQSAARYVRFHVVGIDGSTTLGIDELAVYGGSQYAALGANMFTGYMGDQIEFTPEGHIECVAVDVLKKLADNNDAWLTAAYRITSSGAWELADIAYSLLTSTAYWKSLEANGYDAAFTATDIGWTYGSGLTGLRYPLWQGQTNSILGYLMELFNTIGWYFFADGNGKLQAFDPPTTQRLPDRVCIAGQDGNGDVWGCKRHRTGKQLRNEVIVQTGRSGTSGSGTITLFEPNSIARYGTRTTRITDPLATTTELRRRVAEYFLRDYAWNLQTLTCSIRPQFETRLKDIFGFRAQARPNLYSKNSTVSGDLRGQELWSLVSIRHNICYGKWEADAEWIPYVPQAVGAPNFTALNTIGGDPNELDAVFDVITDPKVALLRFYTSEESAFTGFSLHAQLSNSTNPSHYPITGLTTSVPVWVYITAVDTDGSESIPSQVLTATPGSASQAATCYTITDFTVSSLTTDGPDSQGYYTYQFLGLWTAPACGFTQDDVRAYVEPVPGAGPPSDPTNRSSWPVHDDSWNWWGPDRILQGLTWDNSTPGQLDFVFTLRSKTALSGKRMYWRIWNSSRTRAWREVIGNLTSCVVL